jgi:hypothetical protein
MALEVSHEGKSIRLVVLIVVSLSSIIGLFASTNIMHQHHEKEAIIMYMKPYS